MTGSWKLLEQNSAHIGYFATFQSIYWKYTFLMSRLTKYEEVATPQISFIIPYPSLLSQKNSIIARKKDDVYSKPPPLFLHNSQIAKNIRDLN